MSKTSTRHKRCELLFLQSAVSLTGAAIPTTGLLFFPHESKTHLSLSLKKKGNKKTQRVEKPQGGRGIKMKAGRAVGKERVRETKIEGNR